MVVVEPRAVHPSLDSESGLPRHCPKPVSLVWKARDVPHSFGGREERVSSTDRIKPVFTASGCLLRGLQAQSDEGGQGFDPRVVHGQQSDPRTAPAEAENDGFQ